MVVFMTDEDSLAGSPHTVFHIMFFQALKACEYGRVFFRLCFFGSKGVVRERVQADCFGLVIVERFGKDRGVRGL